jgi:hypothetical protein
MELSEFVKETLVQITNGVKEAQEKCREQGGLVNPMIKVPFSNKERFEISDEYYPLTNVSFKVGLTENKGTENKKGIGVFLSTVLAGTEQTTGSNYQSITSIEFGVNVVFPYISRKGIHVPLSDVLSDV